MAETPEQPAAGRDAASAKEQAAQAAMDAAKAAIAMARSAASGGGVGGGAVPAPAVSVSPSSADTEAEAAMLAMLGGGGTAGAGAGGSAKSGGSVLPSGASAFALPDLSGASPKPLPKGMELLNDVNLDVRIELGRTRMLVEDVLRLGDGTVVELDKLAGDPVDIYVNDRPVARGEVLVLNDNFCVRISEILSRDQQTPRRGG
jgi:flagellar motor switch protein FliN/FliY